METMGKPDKSLDETVKHICDVVQERIDEAYHKGWEYGKEYGSGEADMREAVSYQKGLDDAWEAARRISILESDGGYSWKEMKSIFGTDSASEIYMRHTASEAINKIKAYEEKKADDEIKVGDEMKHVTESGTETGLRCTVTAIDGDRMNGLSQDGRAIVCSSQVNRWWKKTGRHFPIDKILEEMSNED